MPSFSGNRAVFAHHLLSSTGTVGALKICAKEVDTLLMGENLTIIDVDLSEQLASS